MIQREILKEVLLESRGKIDQKNIVKREKLEEIKKFLNLKHALIITGVRRCGKSTLLFQSIKNFDKFYYINFEDERLAGFDIKDFNSLYEVCIELFGEAKVFFVDEIQNIFQWEKWVRRMSDDGFKFFITGSNARLLSKELATLLTGRHIQVSLYPFSFREFLDLKNFEFKKDDLYSVKRRSSIKSLLGEYVKEGGFPEYLKNKRIETLQGYFNDIIQRDVVERYKVANVKQLKELGRYLITNMGNLTSYNQLKKITEIKSVNTVIKYFSYLENSYLVFAVPYFSYSLRKQSVNPFKVFAIDTGLRNSISFRFSNDVGRLYENVVALELKRMGEEIYYWKDKSGSEVDFVVKESLKVKQLIQVCYNLDDTKTKEREIRALLKAGKELKCKNLLIITEDRDGEENAEWFGIRGKIIYIPLWKWLLQ